MAQPSTLRQLVAAGIDLAAPASNLGYQNFDVGRGRHEMYGAVGEHHVHAPGVKAIKTEVIGTVDAAGSRKDSAVTGRAVELRRSTGRVPPTSLAAKEAGKRLSRVTTRQPQLVLTCKPGSNGQEWVC